MNRIPTRQLPLTLRHHCCARDTSLQSPCSFRELSRARSEGMRRRSYRKSRTRSSDEEPVTQEHPRIADSSESRAPVKDQATLLNVAALLLDAGIKPEVVVSSLVDQGYVPDIATGTELVAETTRQRELAQKEERKRHANRAIFWGVAFAGGGGALTLLTYADAASNPGGGTYYVLYGAIAFGAFRILQGLLDYFWLHAPDFLVRIAT